MAANLLIPLLKVRQLAKAYDNEVAPSISHLSKTLKITRGTIRRCRARIRKSGLAYADFVRLSSDEIRAALKNPVTRSGPPARYVTLITIFAEVNKSLCEGYVDLTGKLEAL